MDVTPAPAPATRRRIYLMRHGSVTYFVPGGPPLESTSVCLNEAGRRQASAAGELFARLCVRFDRVIVSGLPRTVETAQRVLAETGQAVTPEVWPDLQEWRAGPLDAVPTEALRAAYVGAFEGVVPLERRFAGGESVAELLDRVHPAIARLRAADDWDTVLMVLHGGVNRAILSLALTGQRIFLGNLSQAPACINALDVGSASGDWVVRYTGLAAYDLLQPGSRLSTLEASLAEYMKVRSAADS